MGRNAVVDREQAEKMKALHDKGYSFRTLGVRFGVSEKAAFRAVKAYERELAERREGRE